MIPYQTDLRDPVTQIARSTFNIDPHRMYLMGHSMGGAGSMFLGVKHASIWAAIGADWDAYWVSYAAYESALGVRAQFFRDQEYAERSYLNALAQCEADNRRAAEQPKPKPKPEPEESDDEDKDEDKEEPKEEEQEQPEVRQVDCDSAIGVPAILDWAPQAVPSEPAPPADTDSGATAAAPHRAAAVAADRPF